MPKSNGSLTVQEAAKRTGLKPWQLRAAVRTGAVAHTRMGYMILFSLKNLDAYAKRFKRNRRR